MKIVAIGGGTGLSTLLKGLKKYELEITAIVAVTDEGGSSGIIRKEFNVPPPGDIRNNFVALAEDERTLDLMMNYRFRNGFLKGHTVGNVLIAAMTLITGSLAGAVEMLSKVLAIKGKVLPVSDELIRLVAEFEDGEKVTGETEIVSKRKRIKSVHLDKEVKALEKALLAVEDADVIVLGPGSLYTSVISNLVVPGIAERISANTGAVKIYISNIMTQPGETDGYALSDHVREVERYAKCKMDYVIVNSQRPPKTVLERYEAEGYEFVRLDVENVENVVVLEPMVRVTVDPYDGKEKIRHDSDRLAEIVVKVARMDERDDVLREG